MYMGLKTNNLGGYNENKFRNYCAFNGGNKN